MDDFSQQHTEVRPASNPSGWGQIVGIIIIVVLLVLGGVYFLINGEQPHNQAPAVGAGRA